MTNKVLIIDDDEELCELVAEYLSVEGFDTTAVHDGEKGLDTALSENYDLAILDVMLPGHNGLAVLADLRAQGIRTPVLVLTARDTVDDKVRGLNVGADDYMTKPFALTELLARVRALIRRASPEPVNAIVAGALVVDTCARIVRNGDTVVDLTAREYAILELLARRKGSVVTRSAIYDHVYDERDETFSNVVDVFIAALRRKVGPGVIHTRRGHGYMIDG